MDREILFRGKRTDNGEWVEGNLITGVFCRGGKDIPYILNADLAEYDCFEDFNEENGIFEVIPDTVCQYTGLTDKNGKMIWDNDIVKLLKCENDICVIILEKCNYYLKNRHKRYEISSGESECYEVIGNIFDNPELLEVD